jgi:hypothetical protein
MTTCGRVCFQLNSAIKIHDLVWESNRPVACAGRGKIASRCYRLGGSWFSSFNLAILEPEILFGCCENRGFDFCKVPDSGLTWPTASPQAWPWSHLDIVGNASFKPWLPRFEFSLTDPCKCLISSRCYCSKERMGVYYCVIVPCLPDVWDKCLYPILHFLQTACIPTPDKATARLLSWNHRGDWYWDWS